MLVFMNLKMAKNLGQMEDKTDSRKSMAGHLCSIKTRCVTELILYLLSAFFFLQIHPGKFL